MFDIWSLYYHLGLLFVFTNKLYRPSTTDRGSTLNTLDVNILPDSKRRLVELSNKIKSNLSPNVINYGSLVELVKDLEIQSALPEFWDNKDDAQLVLTKLDKIKEQIRRVDNWNTSVLEANDLIEMVNEGITETRR